MNPISKCLRAATLAAGLLLGTAAMAQYPGFGGTNGWPITSLNPYPPVVGTLGAGPYTFLNGTILPPATTNQYVPGLTTSTNTTGTNMNQLFIGSSYWNDMGLSLVVIVPTNTAAPYSTNLTGTITVACQKSPDGTHVDNNTAPFYLTLTSQNNYCVLTNLISGTVTNLMIPQGAAYSCVMTDLVLNGAAGFFVTSIANTNIAMLGTALTGGAGPTNYLYLIGNPKIIKGGSVPMTATQ